MNNKEKEKILFFPEDIMHLELASKGKRALNFIIDFIAMYILIIILFSALNVLGFNIIDNVTAYNKAPQNKNAYTILYFFTFGIYIGLQEAITNGRTLGKIITGTKVVTEKDGKSISFWKGFLRGICRMPFFELFSSFGTPCYPWHDKWTNTVVIDIKKSRIVQ